MRKAGIAAAATLFTVILALHNPTEGYQTTTSYCDYESIEANGGRYQPTKQPDGYLSIEDAAKLYCSDASGKNWYTWHELSIWNYESNGVMLEPLRKISGLLFGTALICILLVVWLRLYGKK
jgi:hypothetical protein